MKWQKVVVGFAVCAAGVLGLGSSAYAAGFSLIEQSVSGLGTAYAGGAAVAEDPSTVYFNPAGMMRLEGTQVTAGLHYIMPEAKFSKSSATNALGSPISGGDGGNVGIHKPVPNFYLVRNFENFAVGLGVNAPFGMATEYDKTWVGRYHAVESDVMSVNINPSIAYRVNDKLSVGAGFSAQYFKAILTNMVDFGLSSYSMLGSAAQSAAAGGNLGLASTYASQANALLSNGVVSNPNADIYCDMKADSWGYGYNLGAIYQYSDGGRVGLAYRSRIKHDLGGDADFKAQNPEYLTAFGLSAAAAFPNQGISGEITLPASASLSLYHEVSPKWAVSADATWTEWSTFEDLVIEFDRGLGATGATKTSVTTEKWKDNWRYALGAIYEASDALTLRAGVAYDETPVAKNKYRTPRIPDSSRTWLALGFGYAFSEMVALNVGYAHLFINESKSDKTATGEDLSRGALKGTYDTSVDIASAELVVKF